jgi:tight adherence protein B
LNLWIGLIIVGACVLLVYEFRSIRRGRDLKRVKAAMPGFVELYCSAIQSGVSMEDAFAYISEFKTEGLDEELRRVDQELARGKGFIQVMDDLRNTLACAEADRFVGVLKLAHFTGGQSLVANLQSLAAELRQSNASEGAIEARLGAILVVAKLGLFAPWVLVGVLSVNEQSRVAYLSDAGGILLLAGFVVSVVAYRLVMLAGKQFTPARILVGSSA